MFNQTNLLQQLIDLAPSLRQRSDAGQTPAHPAPIEQRSEPPCTALLGVSSGTPVLLDLSSQQLRPIAVVSDSSQDTCAFMQQITRTALETEQPRPVQIALLKRASSNWNTFLNQYEDAPQMISVDTASRRSEWEAIYELTAIAEKRYQQESASFDPIIILIEDLSVLHRATSDFRLNFEWLCLYGGEVGIQMVCGFRTSEALKMGRWLRYFTTRILGRLPADHSERIGLHPNLDLSYQNGSGINFAVWNHTAWLYFQLQNDDATERNSQ
ncbi:MAG: hypothetical protein JW750_10330 [Anaerolineaceae bacterium]|nr:hypothetical protein [Anaerolineaceae bacterium]